MTTSRTDGDLTGWQWLKARLWPPLEKEPQAFIPADSVYRHPSFFTCRCPLCDQGVNVIAEDARGWLTIAPHERLYPQDAMPWFQGAYTSYCNAGGRAFPVGPADR